MEEKKLFKKRGKKQYKKKSISERIADLPIVIKEDIDIIGNGQID